MVLVPEALDNRRYTLKNFFTTALVCVILGGSLSASVDVVESSSNRLRLSVTIADARNDVVVSTVDDTSVAATTSFVIGVPPNKQPRLADLRVIESRPTDLTLTNLVDLPIASLSTVWTQRGARLVTLAIAPLRNGTLLSHLDITIRFDGPDRSVTDRPSADPHFDPIFAASVVNYEDFSRWPRSFPARSATALATTPEHPFTLTSAWAELRLSANLGGDELDLYRFTGAELAASGLTSVPIPSDRIRLFAGDNRIIPTDAAQLRPDFREVPLFLQDGGDGSFDLSDIAYFIGELPDRWLFRPDTVPQYENNIYTDESIYWLTVSTALPGPSQRMASIAAAPGSADTTITSFDDWVRVEQDNLISEDINGHIEDYFAWHWTNEASLTVFVPTPGIVPGVTVDMLLIGKTNNCCGPVAFMDLVINGSAGQGKICNRFNCSFSTTALIDGANRFDLSFGRQRTSIPPYFDHAEFAYERQLRPEGDKLDLVIGVAAGRAEVVITDLFSSEPWLFRVDDPAAPVRLTGYTRSGGQVRAGLDLVAIGPNRVFATTAAAAVPVGAIVTNTVTDLRSSVPQADLIIVTSEQLAPAMQRYRDYRSTQGVSTHLVTVTDITSNFGYGSPDPTGIRDYLKFAFETFPAPRPAAVLFVGDANYDFTDRLGTGEPNIVPAYIRPGRAAISASFSDDNYVYFGPVGSLLGDTATYVPGVGFDMMTARWPVSTSSEVQIITDKVIAYESPSNLAPWRNRVVLVADDEFAGSSTNEAFHTTQTEELSRNFIPRRIVQEKIYLWEYPFVNRRKPEVNDVIVQAINSGAAVVNYVGHGNPDVWSNERVFDRAGDIPRLTNRDRLPLIFAASCAIAFYDDPQRSSMGEDLLAIPGGGAIGVVAASRLVYSFDNSEFNKKAYEVFFENDSLSFAHIFYAAKLQRQYRTGRFQRVPNDEQYILLGDPFLRIGIPEYRVTFTDAPDSLVGLGRETVVGEVVDLDGQRLAMNGQLTIDVYDSDRSRTYRLANGLQSVTYNVNGPTLFRGTAPIVNGTFSFSFVTPVDIAYGSAGARVVAYANLGTVDASGLVDSIPVASTVAPVTDSVGPAISFAIEGRESFSPGDRVTRDDAFVVRLADTSGINLSGAIGQQVVVEIDNDPDRVIDLTPSFVYDDGQATVGQATLLLDTLPAGEVNVKVKAWDNANNSSTATTRLALVESGADALSEVLTYPNPMVDATTFHFELASPIDRMTIDIFTVAGRKIRTLSAPNLAADRYPNSRLELAWDGTDFAGDRVATGVYLFKAVAVGGLSGETESFGKIVVINQ